MNWNTICIQLLGQVRTQDLAKTYTHIGRVGAPMATMRAKVTEKDHTETETAAPKESQRSCVGLPHTSSVAHQTNIPKVAYEAAYTHTGKVYNSRALLQVRMSQRQDFHVGDRHTATIRVLSTHEVVHSISVIMQGSDVASIAQLVGM